MEHPYTTSILEIKDELVKFYSGLSKKEKQLFDFLYESQAERIKTIGGDNMIDWNIEGLSKDESLAKIRKAMYEYVIEVNRLYNSEHAIQYVPDAYHIYHIMIRLFNGVPVVDSSIVKCKKFFEDGIAQIDEVLNRNKGEHIDDNIRYLKSVSEFCLEWLEEHYDELDT